MRRRRRRRRPKSCSEIAEKIKSPATAAAAATAATTTKRLLPDWLTVNLLLVEKRQARGYCSFPTVGFGCHSTEWVAAAGSGSRQQQSASRDWSSLWGWFWRSLLRLGRVSHCVALRAGERERESGRQQSWSWREERVRRWVSFSHCLARSTCNNNNSSNNCKPVQRWMNKFVLRLRGLQLKSLCWA